MGYPEERIIHKNTNRPQPPSGEPGTLGEREKDKFVSRQSFSHRRPWCSQRNPASVHAGESLNRYADLLTGKEAGSEGGIDFFISFFHPQLIRGGVLEILRDDSC